LEEKVINCEKLEAEVISLRKDLDKSNAQYNHNLKFVKGIETLDKILSFQRSPSIKIDLGYK